MEWLLSNNNHFYDVSIPSVALIIFPLYSYILVSHQTFNTTIPQSSTSLSLVCFSTFRSEGFHQVALTFEFVDEILNFEDLSLNFCYLSFMRKEKQFPFLFLLKDKLSPTTPSCRVYRGFYLSQNWYMWVKNQLLKVIKINNCQLSIDSCYWHQNAEPIHDKPIKALVYNSAVLLHF